MSIEEEHFSPVRIETIPSSDVDTAAQEWQKLEHRIGNTALKNSWNWIAAWQRHFGDSVPHAFLFGRRNGETIGAALIAKPSYLFVPAVALGTADEFPTERTHVHYNQLLVDDVHLQAFSDSLMQNLARERWSLLRLDNMIPSHAYALMRAGRDVGVVVHTDVHPTHALNFDEISEGKDVLSSLSHDTRYKIRRSMRAFEEQFGPLHVTWATTREEAQDILRELMDLHTEHWESRREVGAFNTARLRAYHHDLVDALWPDRVIAFRVRYGDQTIGCMLNFVKGDGVVTNHRSGFQYFPDNKMKPGFVTNVLFMEEARSKGYKEVDFLAGHDEYKGHITNTEHNLIQGFAYRGPRAVIYRVVKDIYSNPTARRYLRRMVDVVR